MDVRVRMLGDLGVNEVVGDFARDEFVFGVYGEGWEWVWEWWVWEVGGPFGEGISQLVAVNGGVCFYPVDRSRGGVGLESGKNATQKRRVTGLRERGEGGSFELVADDDGGEVVGENKKRFVKRTV